MVLELMVVVERVVVVVVVIVIDVMSIHLANRSKSHA